VHIAVRVHVLHVTYAHGRSFVACKVPQRSRGVVLVRYDLVHMNNACVDGDFRLRTVRVPYRSVDLVLYSRSPGPDAGAQDRQRERQSLKPNVQLLNCESNI
jgi:hypothetical protein